MMRFPDLAEPIKVQCDPAESDLAVYVGLEHIDSGALWLSRFGRPADVQSSKNRFKRGDILYGKLRPYLDKAVLMDRDGICSTDILVFRPKANTCPAFIVALIHSSAFLSHAVSTTHGVNHPRTSWAALSEFEWEVPSKSEQERIAAVLWMAQRAIEVQDKLVRTTCELKQAAMRKLFTHGLRNEPVKETEIGPLPESWNIVPVAKHFRVVAGGTPSRANSENWMGGSIPWLKTGEVNYTVIYNTEERITESAVRNSAAKLIPAGTIVVAMYGQGITRGKVAILGINATTNQACAALVSNGNDMHTDFVFQYLTYSYERLRNLAHGGQQQNLNAEMIKGFPLPETGIDEQRDIAHNLQTIDRKIWLHEQKRAALQDLFKTLLHKLMTAQIRVHNLDIDTSEVTAC